MVRNGELLRSSPLKNKSKIHTLFLGRNFVKEHPECLSAERERERESSGLVIMKVRIGKYLASCVKP
jgi:hypothetical protein